MRPRRAKRQGYLVATLTAFAIAVGLTGLPPRHQREQSAPSPGPEAVYGARARGEPGPPMAPAAAHRPAASSASGLERGGTFETPPAEAPRHLGEPLNADRGEAESALTSGRDPVNLGPERHLDAPLASESAVSTVAPRNLGASVDADAPALPPMTETKPRALGIELNADAPRGLESEREFVFPVELGEIIDAKAPPVR